MMMNRFTRNLDTTAQNLSVASERSLGTKFSRSSDDVSSALQAFNIRRALSRTELYQSNINEVKGVLEQTETTMMGINEILVQAQTSLVQGSNGTMSTDAREAVADIFDSLQEQLLKLANTNFAGKYIFGGTNTTSNPFTVSSGKLYYNGQDVDSAVVDSDEVYIDLGLGLTFDGSGALQKNTAFSISTPGNTLLGYGKDADGWSNNAYNYLGEVAASLRSGDMSNITKQSAKLTDMADNMMVTVAGIGEKVKFVEFLDDRYASDTLNLQKRQSEVEDVNLAEAYTNYTMAQTTYTAALQMGAKIIQKSLLDFM
jgi:flagellar hook-associated protein 3 FlgL